MRRFLSLLVTGLLVLCLAGCSGGPLGFLLSKAAVQPPPEDYSAQVAGFRYARSLLPPQEQAVYDQLASGLLEQKESIEDLYPDTAMIQRAVEAIDRDYPEFFWFAGNGKIETTLMGERPMKAVYRPSYTMNPAQRSQTQARINAWESACLAGLAEGASDYDKALYIYRYIIDHADYVTVEDNSIAHIMVDGGGLC